MAHAVEDHAVGHGLVELGAAELHELRDDALAHRVDLRDERVGERVLPAAQDADAHVACRHGILLAETALAPRADSSTRVDWHSR